MARKGPTKRDFQKKRANFSKLIEKFFRDNPGKSLNYKQLSAQLGVAPEDDFSRLLVREVLDHLTVKGIINADEHGKYSLHTTKGYVVGRVDMTSSGKAFLIVEGMEKDVVIQPHNTFTALHGDTVRAFLLAKRKRTNLEGEIVEVLERAREEFVGTLDVRENFAFFLPDSDRMPMDIFIPLSKLHQGQHGQKVVVRITEWPDHKKNPIGEVVRVLGTPGENETEMHAILAEYGFPSAFPEEVEAYAEGISFTLDPAEIAKRRDLRGVTTFTIDPEDAKDFDDALSFRTLPNGHVEVGIHIADVSHYMPEGSALDIEAFKRATSVYLVDRVVPMLPEKLSNGVCSLRPNEDKFTFSAIFEMDEKGNVHHEWFGRTVTHSIRRFSYEEAQQVIETGQGDLHEEIAWLWKVASQLRNHRFAEGALRVSQSEVKFKLDVKGKPLGVYFKVTKEANHLIEEFMLLANRRVASFCGEKRRRQDPIRTMVYRIHDSPDMDKLREFKKFVAKLGYTLDLSNKKAVSQSINQLLADVKGKPEQGMIETLSIRSMAKAVYTTKNIGHYGLAFDYYTHFTSPIRRYPDVMVHRLLQHYLDGGASVPEEPLAKKCVHSSAQEKRATEAERASTKYKQVEYMAEHVGEVFDGIISGVTERGLFVEIVENKCEGMARLREMDTDFYVFDEKNYCVRGQRSGRVFRLGDAIKVRVKAANLDKRQLDFKLVLEDEEQF